jgi:tetratricopeptide (TPR) repeat protein
MKFLRATALTLFAALGLLACGGSSTPRPATAAPVVRAVAPSAIAKLSAGAEAAKAPGGRERAIGLMREATTIDPRLWEAHYDLGVLLAQTGDLAGAEASLARAAELAPDSEEASMALGQVRRLRGEGRRAAEGLKAFLDRHPDATSIRAVYVGALRDGGQLDAALAEAHELLRRRAGDPAALAELALSELAKGDRESADLLVKEALAKDKGSAIAHRTAGLIALAKGDDAAAFAAFARASELDPKDTTARLNMGTVLLRAGVYGKAEEQFRAVLAVSHDDAAASIGLATALRAQADKDRPARYQEARKLLETVLARDPHNVDAAFDLAVLLADFLKRPADAKPLFQRFLADAGPDHPARPEAERQVKTLSR